MAQLVFSSEFDRLLADGGPPAIFLFDREGSLRLEPGWTRDAWSRDPGPHAFAPCWTLCRDRGTGYVQIVLSTSPTLLAGHPRQDTRVYADLSAAREARDALGPVPIDREPWC